MTQKIIPLVVLEKNSEIQSPEIEYVNFEKLSDIDVSSGILGTNVQFDKERLRVAGHPFDLEALADMNSTDPFIVQRRDLAQAALGAAQGAGLAVAKFLTEVTTATAATADGVDLPAATVGGVHAVINNHATVTLDIFPASSEFIGNLAVNIATQLAPGQTIHFYCIVAGTWAIVVDNG